MAQNNKDEMITQKQESKLETRTITFDLEPLETRENEPKVLKGIAIKYNVLSEPMYDQFYERINPRALDKTLKENDQVALWGHDSMYVLGRKSEGTLKLINKADGLHFEITPPSTTWANDLIESVKRKDIKQMSFGFNVVTDKWYADEDSKKKHGLAIREIEELKLYEISLVTFPAYTQTSVRNNNIQGEYIPTPPKDDSHKLEASIRSRKLDIQKRKC